MVSSGSAVPVRTKNSKPASRSRNSGFGMDVPSARMASLAAYKIGKKFGLDLKAGDGYADWRLQHVLG